MSNIDFSRMIPAAENARETERAAARYYLQSTDWMVLREAETGTPVPAKIRAARQAARQKLGG